MSYQKIDKPNTEQEVSDEMLGLEYTDAGDMRNGLPLEYDYKRFMEGRSDAPQIFENIIRKGELAKRIVILDEFVKAFDQAFPEPMLMRLIDDYIEKCGDMNDVNKTNLPHAPVKTEDSSAYLSPEEREKAEKDKE